MSIITLNTRSLPDSAVTTAKINADAVTDAKVADDVIGTEHLTAGEVDATALGANAVTAAKLSTTAITGQTAETSAADADTIIIHDDSASALKKMTRSNFLSGVGGTNTPMFHAYLGSNQSISSGTETKVALDQEAIDTDNAFASNKFTVPSGEAGKYYIEGSVSLGNTDGNTSTTGFCFVTLHKNGTNIGGDQRIDPRNNNGSAFSIQISAILDLSAGDYIELFGSGQISSAQHFYGGTGAVARTYLLGYKLIT